MRVAGIRQKTLHKSLLDNHQRVQNDQATIRIALQIILISDDHGWWRVQWAEAVAKMVAVL